MNFPKLFTASKLRTKFIFYFTILSVVPLLVLGGVALYLIDLSHRQDVSNLELQLIDQKIEEIKKFFADTLGILELRVGFVQKSEIEISQQEFLLDGLLEENPAFEEVSFINLKGKETSRKTRFSGRIELQDVSNLKKFQQPIDGQNYIGDIYYTLSGPAVTLAAPVRNKNGDIIQVLSAEVNLSKLARSVESARLGVSGYLVFLDKNGVVAAGGVPNLKPGVDLSQSARVRQILQGQVFDGIADQDRYLSFFNQAPVVGAGKRLQDIGWVLMAEWPIADADAVINDIRAQVMRLTIFSVILVLIVAAFVASRLVKPIRQLQEAAHRIEMGQFEQAVAVRTNDELQELAEEFNEMAKGLKRLAELKDEFVFVAAHELRAPSTAIKWSLAEMEEESRLDSKAKEYLFQARRANERLLQLVEDLLEVARSEAGRIAIKCSPMNIIDSVRAALEEQAVLAEQKSMKLNYEPRTVLPQVLADPDRLKEIVVNLVGNAIKYSPSGKNIWVSHEVQGRELITHVKDEGFGISKEAQQKLFEKFYRVQTDQTREIQGTGLGLFIVKQLVEKMNGRIWIKSEQDKGSIFSFSLPIV